MKWWFNTFSSVASGMERVQTLVHLRYDWKHEVCHRILSLLKIFQDLILSALVTTYNVLLRSIIRRWHNALFTDDIKKKLGITERQVNREKDLAWPCRSPCFVTGLFFTRLSSFCNDRLILSFFTRLSCFWIVHLDLQVYSSATLLELDDIYTRRLAGFTNLPGFNIDNHGCHHCYIVININIIIFNCLVAGFTNLPGLRLSRLLSSLQALLSSLLIS